MSLVRKRYAVIVATSLLATTVLGAGTTLAQSTSAKKVAIPSAGITTVLDSYETAADKKTELEAIVKVNVSASEQKTQKIQSKNTDGDDSIYDDIAISSVENFVNVRKEANTDAEIVGVIYDECAATIESEEGDWYKIKSGNVEGYVAKMYFLTGEAAKAKAMECGYVNAKVTTTTLNVRTEQNETSEILTQIPEGEKYDVIEYGSGWVYLNIDEDVRGWVSDDYVTVSVDFDTALTLEEQQAKIAEEERIAEAAAEAERQAEEYRKQQEEAEAAAEEAKRQAAAQAEEAAQNTYSEPETQAEATYTEPETQATYTEPETEAAVEEAPVVTSGTGSAVVAYAMQFVGNPYVYGGSSLTGGTDCSGFTMSVYAHFGVSLPHSSRAQSGCGTQVAVDANTLQPGDLLFYTNGGSTIGHVALYIGGGQIVHASTPSSGIIVSNAFYRTPACAVRLVG